MPILKTLDMLISAGVSWDTALERVSGQYYSEEVQMAAKEYLRKQPQLKVNIPGYQRFLESQK
jgi:hypothetical protein